MKILSILLILAACSSAPKEEDKLLGKEKKFLQSLQKRALLVPQSYELVPSEQDAVLKGLINYYPFADVKLVTQKMSEKKSSTAMPSIESFMKEENDLIIDQMLKLIEAFRVIPQEQMARTQESLDRFSFEIRRRQQNYKTPLKCFNDKDCLQDQQCLQAGFCVSR